jgi:adenylate kinase
MPRIVLLGAPGSGKGTKGAILVKKYDMPAISSGDALRANLEAGTPLGLEAKRYMEAGELVPDNLIISFVEDLIEKADTTNGFLLDGFPRTIEQAKALDILLAGKSLDLEKVFFLSVSADILIDRIANRRVCSKCGEIYHLVDKPPKEDSVCDICATALAVRKDDEAETVRKRIEVYEELTQPLVDYYKDQGILVEIDASIEIDEQVSQMVSVIEAI